MPKTKLFTTGSLRRWGLERENRRTRLPKSALLEVLADESIRTRRFPALVSEGSSTPGGRG